MIGYYVHHHGLGHLHRAQALVRQLDARSVRTELLSSLPAPAGLEDRWTRLVPDEVDAPVDPTARGALHWAPLHHQGLRERYRTISGWIADSRPDLLVSDVSQEVSLLARLHGVPVVSVVQPGRRDDDAHRLGLRVSERLVGFWPPEANGVLEGLAPELRHRLVAVGAMSRYLPEAAPSRRRPRHALVMEGSGGAAWTPGELDALQAGARGWSVQRIAPGGAWARDPWPLLRSAAVVVTHAGQNAVAEVAAARVPALVVPADRPFDEQHHTVAELARGGWPCLTTDRLGSVDPGTVLDQVQVLDGERWAGWCDGGAASRFADVVTDVLVRTAPAVAS